jgi:Tol biopolymer transport system component
MMRLILRLSFLLLLTLTALMFVTRAWGQTLPPNPLLAYTAGNNINLTLHVLDPSHAVEINLGSITLGYFSRPSWSVDGNLVFRACSNGNCAIYVWDGTSTINISDHTALAFAPVWSPDGHLAFISQRDGSDQVYVWNGATAVNISHSGGLDRRAAWSIDGRLAFMTYQEGIGDEVRVWDGTQTITALLNIHSYDYQMEWSHDGRLAVVSRGLETNKLYVWDGLTANVVLEDSAIMSELAWSPDGQLAFALEVQNGNREIYVWDGVAISNISQSPLAQEQHPVWSSDGRLAFASFGNGFSELYIWDGVSVTNISQTALAYDIAYAWNGEAGLSFTMSYPNGACDIYFWDNISLSQITFDPTQCEFSEAWWTP